MNEAEKRDETMDLFEWSDRKHRECEWQITPKKHP
jgi:hypothetical protein